MGKAEEKRIQLRPLGYEEKTKNGLIFNQLQHNSVSGQQINHTGQGGILSSALAYRIRQTSPSDPLGALMNSWPSPADTPPVPPPQSAATIRR